MEYSDRGQTNDRKGSPASKHTWSCHTGRAPLSSNITPRKGIKETYRRDDKTTDKGCDSLRHLCSLKENALLTGVIISEVYFLGEYKLRLIGVRETCGVFRSVENPPKISRTTQSSAYAARGKRENVWRRVTDEKGKEHRRTVKNETKHIMSKYNRALCARPPGVDKADKIHVLSTSSFN